MIGEPADVPHSGNDPQTTFAPGTFAVRPPKMSTSSASAAAAAVPRNNFAGALAGAPPPRSPARTSASASVASSEAASTQCTIVASGAFWKNTVTAPKSAVAITIASAATAGRSTPPLPPTPASPRARYAANAVAAMVTVRMSPINRCVHSTTSVELLIGGNHAPWHMGQCSPQPMPDPEIRTKPPNMMCTTARASEARRNARNDVGMLTDASRAT